MGDSRNQSFSSNLAVSLPSFPRSSPTGAPRTEAHRPARGFIDAGRRGGDTTMAVAVAVAVVAAFLLLLRGKMPRGCLDPDNLRSLSLWRRDRSVITWPRSDLVSGPLLLYWAFQLANISAAGDLTYGYPSVVELDSMAENYPDSFKIYYVLNQPTEAWNGGVGFVSREMIQTHCPAPAADIQE
ncbi:hypothetical protein ABZP36_014248 [Zizania latifolia]